MGDRFWSLESAQRAIELKEQRITLAADDRTETMIRDILLHSCDLWKEAERVANESHVRAEELGNSNIPADQKFTILLIYEVLTIACIRCRTENATQRLKEFWEDVLSLEITAYGLVSPNIRMTNFDTDFLPKYEKFLPEEIKRKAA